MKFESFEELPDESSLWIYGFESELSNESEAQIRGRLQNFLSHWETHGQPVRGAFEIVGSRFVILAGHCVGGISGCSVDSSVGIFKQLREEGLNGLDRSRIYFRTAEGTIESVHFSLFQAEIDAGKIDARSPVFDTNLTQLGELRSSGFEKPLIESWHSKAFSAPQESA